MNENSDFVVVAQAATGSRHSVCELNLNTFGVSVRSSIAADTVKTLHNSLREILLEQADHFEDWHR